MTFLSSDKTHKINCFITETKEPPIAVLMFFHGMAEHIERYESTAKVLADEGISLCMFDALGHGKSVNCDDELGYFAKKDGWKVVVEDGKLFFDILKSKFPQAKMFVGGHSMGSFMARAYASKYGDECDGAVFVGTGFAQGAVKFGTAVAKIVGLFCGKKHRSKFLDSMSFGAYNKNIKDAKTPFDWLSVNEENVDKYIKDPLCGFVFTASGFADVSAVLNFVSSKKCALGYPKELPVLFVAGKDDPVGNYGSGVQKAALLLESAGLNDVTTVLYDDMRHEVLNEKEGESVARDIAFWVKSK